MSENIAVFFGGVSSENEISVITGTMVCNVLKRGGMNVFPVYITQSGAYLSGVQLFSIKNFANGAVPAAKAVAFAAGGMYICGRRSFKKFVRIDCAVNCCHGGWGEGGGVSGLCAAMSLPLASAGIFESSLFLDKYLTKLALSALGVPTVEYVYLSEGCSADGIAHFPVMVKPARLGSSIGVARADNAEQLNDALSAAFLLDDGVLIERCITNRREINCAVCLAGGELAVSPCEEVFGGDILSYDDKYSGSGKRVCPADLPEDTEKEVKGIASLVYTRLNMRGIVRFDFILDGQTVYLSEVNTVPGSLSNYLLAENYDDFYKLLCSLIATAQSDRRKAHSKLLLNTGIINNFASNTCKIK